MEVIETAFQALQVEATTYSSGVQIWMRVMAISFFFGLVFVLKRTGARWVLLTMVFTFVGLVVGKAFFPELSRAFIGSLVHSLLWPILLLLVWRQEARPVLGASFGDRFYFVWVVWVTLLISISLVFDVGLLLGF